MERERLILKIVIVINILGGIAGFFYYRYQLSLSPVKFWVFIPDCPLATLMFAVAAYRILIGKKADWLSFLASAAVIKYGLWTMFVTLFYRDYFFYPTNAPFYSLMFFLHFGMAIEPSFIIRTIDFKKWHVLLSIAWLGLNDYFDYVLGTNPLHFSYFSSIETVGAITAISTMVISLGLYGLKYRKFWPKNMQQI